MHYDYIVIGNGIAGHSAIKELIKHEGRILLITKEKYHTYFRTQLSHFISKEFSDKELYLTNDKFFKDNNIDVLLDTEVVKLDYEKKMIATNKNDEYTYEKLLLATGSSPFVPPLEKTDSKGVFAIRDLDDLYEFKKELKEANKVAVIGGGILGLEAAKSIFDSGKEVIVIESFDYILSRQLDKKLSERLKNELETMGIHCVTGKFTKKIVSNNGKIEYIETTDGEKIACDMVLIQAGIRANVKLAKESGLKVNRAVVVDKYLQTSAKDIYAAGDCVEINGVNLGLWTSSMEMGKIAAINMTGGNTVYEIPKPFTLLNLGKIKIFSAGSVNENEKEVNKDDNIYKIFADDHDILGGILYGDIKYMNDIKKIVFEKNDIKNLKINEIFNL